MARKAKLIKIADSFENVAKCMVLNKKKKAIKKILKNQPIVEGHG